MNKINSTWQIKPLNSFGIFLRGVSCKKVQLLKEKTLNSVFLLRANNIQEKLDLTDLQIVPKELSEGKIIQNNDILFAMSSGSMHIVGKNILLKDLQDFSFGAFCVLFRITSKELNPNFLDYFLKSDFYKKYIINCARGTNINNLRFSDLQKLLIPIPPLEIQKEIAARLDFSFDKIEKGIKYLKLAKENIIEYKQSMLKYAFEGKLTDCNNWEIKTLGEVCEILDNIRKPINATERKQRLKKSNLRYAYYGATGQIGYIDNFLFDFEAILLGEDGAPFLEPFKNKAYIVSGKYWVNNHAHILRAKDNISINKFLCYFLNTVDYMPYVSGTTRLKLNQFSMKQIKIPIPPLETQKEIVSILDKSFESADNMLKYVEDSLYKAELLKRALLRDAFNGKI